MTPTDIFKSQLRGIGTSELPQVNPGASIGDLESAISNLQALEQQEQNLPIAGNATGIPGFAGGGALGPGPAQFGTTKTAVLVGDATMNGDEEVLIHDRMTGMAEVIPLAGRAQGGAVLPANLTVLPELFKTLRSDVLGVGNVNPNVQNNYAGLSALGFGTQPGTARCGQAGALGTPLSVKQGLIETLNYTPEQAQQLSDLIGILPAPHKAAKFLRSLSPVEQQALVSAYKLAGWTEAQLNDVISGSMITGPQRVGVSLR